MLKAVIVMRPTEDISVVLKPIISGNYSQNGLHWNQIYLIVSFIGILQTGK